MLPPFQKYLVYAAALTLFVVAYYFSVVLLRNIHYEIFHKLIYRTRKLFLNYKSYQAGPREFRLRCMGRRAFAFTKPPLWKVTQFDMYHLSYTTLKFKFLSDRCFLTANHIKPGPESLGCSVFFPYKALVCSLLADFARSNHGEEGLCFHAQLTLSWKVRVEEDLTAAGWFKKKL